MRCEGRGSRYSRIGRFLDVDSLPLAKRALHEAGNDNGDGMILVTGHVTAKPDTIDELLRVSRAHVARSRKEPGCISHHVTIDADDPMVLHFIERWADEAALKTHFKVPESRAMWRALQSLAADPGAMHIYDAREVKV